MSPVITLPTEHGIVLASQVSELETHLVLRLPALPDSQVERLPPLPRAQDSTCRSKCSFLQPRVLGGDGPERPGGLMGNRSKCLLNFGEDPGY